MNINTRPVTALLPIVTLCLVLTGCGGGGSSSTGTGSALALSATDSRETTDTTVASPSPCPSPSDGADGHRPKSGGHAMPGDELQSADRPLPGDVQSIDSATGTLVIGKPATPARADDAESMTEGTVKASLPASLTVITDSTTTYVKKNGKGTADTTATFADIQVGTRIAVSGTVDVTAATVTATKIELLPVPVAVTP